MPMYFFFFFFLAAILGCARAFHMALCLGITLGRVQGTIGHAKDQAQVEQMQGKALNSCTAFVSPSTFDLVCVSTYKA